MADMSHRKLVNVLNFFKIEALSLLTQN